MVLRLSLRVWVVVGLLLAIAVLFGLEQLRRQLEAMGVLTWESPVQRWLYMLDERSITAWFSASLLLVCSLVAARIARDTREMAMAVGWWGLVVGFAFMSMDETISVHEHFAELLLPGMRFDGPFGFAWVVVGLPLVGLALLLYLPFLLRLPRHLAALLLLAGAIYFGGALLLEMLSAYIFANRELYYWVALFEEVLEVLGLTALIYALLTTDAFYRSKRAVAYAGASE
jgi:hypothetical protein